MDTFDTKGPQKYCMKCENRGNYLERGRGLKGGGIGGLTKGEEINNTCFHLYV